MFNLAFFLPFSEGEAYSFLILPLPYQLFFTKKIKLYFWMKITFMKPNSQICFNQVAKTTMTTVWKDSGLYMDTSREGGSRILRRFRMQSEILFRRIDKIDNKIIRGIRIYAIRRLVYNCTMEPIICTLLWDIVSLPCCFVSTTGALVVKS